MAKTRVHDLAKEFGMTSKEMLAYLKKEKIPAKSASSTLQDVYVNLVRKKLKPVAEAHAKEIAAEKKEEKQVEAAKEAEEKKRAEAERIAAEKRRAHERAIEKKRKEQAAKKKAEEERVAEEKAKAEEAKKKAEDNAPKSIPSFTSLLDQIAQQEKVLEKKQEEKKAKESQEHERSNGRRRSTRSERSERNDRGNNRGGRNNEERNDHSHSRGRQGFSMDEIRRQANATPYSNDERPGSRGESRRRSKRNKRRNNDESEDRYARMARAAEEYNREHVLEEAREAVEEATRESTGRRKRRKERRVKQKKEAEKEKKIEEARKNDQDLSQIDTIKVPSGATVAQLADLLKVPANDIIKRLFLLGTPLTMTQSMTDDQIELIADDLGRDVKVMTKEEENSFTFYDDPKDLKPRPPVVTVMGHVDHGKTSLLDAIRHTGVAEEEAGGITQAIGASQVKIHGRTITFIDTPGHATFTAMRARGAKVTDIVILIVAADDGVMPQTIESIHHAQAAKVPIIVAVNKIDKPGADPQRVRQQLTEYGLVPEEWGGDTMFCDISAKKRIGIDNLLESILLEADVLELKANPDTFASGYVLEAKLDKGRGSVATLLINRGTLHVGDYMVAGLAYGRVRAMLDQHGKPLKAAMPSDPVEVLGLQQVPDAGDEFRIFDDERDARGLAEQRQLKARIEEQNKAKHVTLENLFDTMEESEVKELNLIVKADVQGSIEALVDGLSKLDQSEVRINVIHSAVGAINETDVLLADASNAIIIGFGVRPDAKARQAAEKAGVEIRTYKVIYQALEDIDKARIGMLKPTEKEIQTATIEVRQTYKVPKVGVAAGCMVQEGEVAATDQVRLVRDGIVVYDGTIASLRRYKDEVKSVKAGFECGISLQDFQDIHIGDTLESYKIVEVKCSK
ncbi:MAG: translation initiation factor IF-2 [Coriobacteriaceae bacterium]|nr:MAG: translation initiation factor IF-2 [Coriobacteriaceae bacterium]